MIWINCTMISGYELFTMNYLLFTMNYFKKFGYKSIACYLCRPLKLMPRWSRG